MEDDIGFAANNMHCIGVFHKGDEVTDSIALDSEMTEAGFKAVSAEYYVAYANDDVLADYSKQLQATAGTLDKPTDSHLVGSVNAPREGRLFFTIPYDEGWSLTVDGEETPLEKTADLFLSAPVAAGAHSYELRFFPVGMKQGMLFSCGAVVLILLLMVYNLLGRRSRTPVEQKKTVPAGADGPEKGNEEA